MAVDEPMHGEERRDKAAALRLRASLADGLSVSLTAVSNQERMRQLAAALREEADALDAGDPQASGSLSNALPS